MTNAYNMDRQLLPIPLNPSKCPLLACFYAEFDNVVGPKVCFQSPENFMDRDICTTSDQMHQHLSDAFSKILPPSREKNSQSNKCDPTLGNFPAVERGGGGCMKFDDSKAIKSMTDDDSMTAEHFVSKDSRGTVDVQSVPAKNMDSSSQSSGIVSPSSQSIFDSTSEYIITGNELADQMICLSAHNMHILSRPTIIVNTRYERNSLLFSVGFILRRAEDPRPFRPLISKLSATLCSMEVESQFLSNARTRPHLQQVLERILVSLNSPQAECNLLLDDGNSLNLKLFKPPKALASPVPDYAVPVLLRPEWQLQMFDWDLTINWIVPHINGLKYARLISQSSEVDMEMVRACLRVLKHHGVLAFVDIFRYSNRYESTGRAAAMLAGRAPQLLNAAFNFVAKTCNKVGVGNTASSVVLDSSAHSGRDSSPGTELHHQVQDIPVPHASSARENSFPVVPPQILASASSFPPRTNSMMGIHGGNGIAHNKLRSDFLDVNVAPLKKEHRVMKAALAELYCSCNRNETFGDILIAKVTSSVVPDAESKKTDYRVSEKGELHSEEDMLSTSPQRERGTVLVRDRRAIRHHKADSLGQSLSQTDEPHSSHLYPHSGEGETIANGVGCSSHDISRSMKLDQKQKNGKKRCLNPSQWKEAFEYFDHRRFVTFGVIYGLINRVHNYPLAYSYDFDVEEPIGNASELHPESPNGETLFSPNEQILSSEHQTPVPGTPSPPTPHQKGAFSSRSVKDEGKTQNKVGKDPEKLKRLARKVASSMDGTRCDDELSCKYQRPLPELIELVETVGRKAVVSVYSTASAETPQT